MRESDANSCSIPRSKRGWGIEDSAPATRHPLPVTRFKREAERTAVQVGRTMTVDVGTVIHDSPPIQRCCVPGSPRETAISLLTENELQSLGGWGRVFDAPE